MGWNPLKPRTEIHPSSCKLFLLDALVSDVEVANTPPSCCLAPYSTVLSSVSSADLLAVTATDDLRQLMIGDNQLVPLKRVQTLLSVDSHQTPSQGWWDPLGSQADDWLHLSVLVRSLYTPSHRIWLLVRSCPCTHHLTRSFWEHGQHLTEATTMIPWRSQECCLLEAEPTIEKHLEPHLPSGDSSQDVWEFWFTSCHQWFLLVVMILPYFFFSLILESNLCLLGRCYSAELRIRPSVYSLFGDGSSPHYPG